MPLPSTSHRLFERTWRSTCPIRPRHSVLRRWTGIALLAILCVLIVGYAYLTDADRVRQQAEAYLSRLVGGPVAVQRASLSLFEGLRLEGVTIRTPQEGTGSQAPDAVFFTARSLRIDYSPWQLLSGRISAQRIIAVDPHVRLTENLDNGAWNFQSLRRRTTTGPAQFVPPEELPEILLRNAQVELARVVDGELVPRGSVGIEAQLVPAVSAGSQVEHAYAFSVQTLGLSSSEALAGPRARGVVNLQAGTLEASLQDVDFGALMDILPRGAGEWWQRHGISGQLDLPQLRLDWNDMVLVTAPDGTQERVPRFRAVVRLEHAQMQGLPEEWLPAEEIAARRQIISLLQAAISRTAEGPTRDVLTSISDSVQLRPLRLRDVRGSFVFTHTGVRVSGLVGDFEGNRLRVDGIVDGYSTDAALSLAVQNADESISLPARVDYVSSLPRQVREIYQRFLPMGKCRLRLELHRPAATADGKPVRPIVTGHMDVLDGTFKLDRFPYPVREAQGRLLLKYNRETQQDQLVIENLRGVGLAGGPNQSAQISVNGMVGPLTSHAGFDITVAGTDVSNEPALVSALPKAARETISNFDPAHHGKGVGPNGEAQPVLAFGGDFLAHVTRPPGPRQKWDWRVDLFLRDMSGAFAAFPYPLVNAAGTVTVFRDHVEIADARTSHPSSAEGQPPATADVSFGGRVDWGRRPADRPGGRPPIRLDLNVTGSNVSTDAAMLGALPPRAVEQLAALGAGGVADLSARIFTDDQDALQWDVALDLKEGRFWPETGAFNLAEASGRVRVLPDRVELTNLTGRRGEGTLTIDGSIELGESGQTDARVAAKGVVLDAATYDLLPVAARDAWDWLQPSGTTDAEITYRGPTALFWGSEDARTAAAEGDDPQYEVILRPQGASALPRAFPYALQNVRGDIRITPGRIALENMTAEHRLGADLPPVKLALSGIGEIGAGEDGGDLWRIKPRISDAPLDEALLAALPEGLRKTITSVNAGGTISAEFERLELTTHPMPGAPVEPVAGANPPPPPINVDFAVKVTTSNALLEAGAPMSNVRGAVSLSGKYLRGELDSLAGAFAAESFSVRGRDGTDLQGTIALPSGSNTLSIENIEAQLAGGQLAGTARLLFSETPDEPARYSVEMAVREADVRRLVGEQPGRAADFSGHMTARLDLEGTFAQPASRRGRGEVIVEGQKLYDLPLVLGLLQVTTLALPLAEPFREASAGFTIDGQKVIFDHIALRAADMQMTGQGILDFESEKVDLTFTTSSAGWAAIPLLGDLMGVARNELLRIHVRGTLQSPEVSGSTLPTVTSTIDEVFRRD